MISWMTHALHTLDMCWCWREASPILRGIYGISSAQLSKNIECTCVEDSQTAILNVSCLEQSLLRCLLFRIGETGSYAIQSHILCYMLNIEPIVYWLVNPSKNVKTSACNFSSKIYREFQIVTYAQMHAVIMTSCHDCYKVSRKTSVFLVKFPMSFAL